MYFAFEYAGLTNIRDFLRDKLSFFLPSPGMYSGGRVVDSPRLNWGRGVTKAASGGEAARDCGMARFLFDFAAIGSMLTLCSLADSELRLSSVAPLISGALSGLAILVRGGVEGGLGENMGVSCRVEVAFDGALLAKLSSKFGILDMTFFLDLAVSIVPVSASWTNPKLCGKNKLATMFAIVATVRQF